MGLEDLASAANVSRSMLSAIERGSKTPSISILARIANGLGVTVARLLDEQQVSAVIITRKGRHRITGESGRWERRVLSPVLGELDLEFMRTAIQPGVSPGVFTPHPRGTVEYLMIDSGTLMLTIDGIEYRLEPGDSICYRGDCWHSFSNPFDQPCIYYMVTYIPQKEGGVAHAHDQHEPGSKY
jgi:transcriptional regulator with XRE-family HTH domain